MVTLSNGTWTYVLDQSAVQGFDANDVETDSYTSAKASDGTEQKITVTITGAADASKITVDVSGSVTEGNVTDAAVTATGSLSILDVDAEDDPVFA